MSYIRCSTPVRKRRGDGAYRKTSLIYAYGGDKYITISMSWIRTKEMLIDNYGKKEGTKMYNEMEKSKHGQMLVCPMIFLTDAEMRFMCRNYLSRIGEVKGMKRNGEWKK